MLRRKSREWLRRYLPAEIAGTVTALSAAGISRMFTSELVVIAYAGSIGEAIGFYSTTLIQRIVQAGVAGRNPTASFSLHMLRRIAADILLEFGPAGLIDGLLLRPFFMFLLPLYVGNFTLGILLGKFAGDITFYSLVILSYELKKRRTKNR